MGSACPPRGTPREIACCGRPMHEAMRDKRIADVSSGFGLGYNSTSSSQHSIGPSTFSISPNPAKRARVGAGTPPQDRIAHEAKRGFGGAFDDNVSCVSVGSSGLLFGSQLKCPPKLSNPAKKAKVDSASHVPTCKGLCPKVWTIHQYCPHCHG